MTAAIPAVVMQRTAEPATCMACGRISTGIGVHEPKKPPGAWTCDSPECIAATKAMVRMPAVKLTPYESRALGDAAKATADDCLRTCMEAFHAAGARDLDAITADQIDGALDRLIVEGALALVIKDALAAFGQSIRDQLGRNDPPF